MIFFGEDKLPIFPYPRVLYKGQPMLLVYAPSQEEAELFKSMIEVTYEEEVSPEIEVVKGLTYSSPEFDQLEGTQISPPLLQYTSTRRKPRNLTQAIAYFDQYHNMVVHSQSSWIHHTQRAIAAATGISLPRVQVYRKQHKATHGEGFVETSAVSLLAAMVTKVTGHEARIEIPLPTYAPRVTAEHRLFQNDEGVLQGILIMVSLDMGATTLFSDEVLNTLMHQIAFPLTELPIKVELSIVRSHTPPTYTHRDFFSSIGATIRDVLIQDLSRTSELSPAEWLLQHYTEEPILLYTGEDIIAEQLHASIEDVVTRSDYRRKYGIYTAPQTGSDTHTQAREITHISEQYCRGVGIAVGLTKNSPSLVQPQTLPWQIEAHLSEHEELAISTGLSSTTAFSQWAYLGRKILAIPRSNVSVKQSGTLSLPDSGPDFLERSKTVLSAAVQRSLELIKVQRELQPPPITVQTLVQKQASDLFFSWGSVVVEVSLEHAAIPFIRGVWVTTRGQVWEKAKLLGEMHEVILHKYQELILVDNYRNLCYRHGVDIIPIHLNLIPSTEHNASPISVVQNFFPAAFIQALSVALGKNITKLPLSPRDIATLQETP